MNTNDRGEQVGAMHHCTDCHLPGERLCSVDSGPVYVHSTVALKSAQHMLQKLKKGPIRGRVWLHVLDLNCTRCVDGGRLLLYLFLI